MDSVIAAAERLGNRILDFAPSFALLVLVLVGGVVLSRIGAKATRWLVEHMGLEVLAERFGISKLLYAIGLRVGVAHLLERLAYAAGLMLTALAAAELAGLTVLADSLVRVVGYLPQALIALLVVLIGIRVADIARGMILRSVEGSSRVESPELIGAIAYYGIIVLTFTLAADQLGLQTKLIYGLILIAAGALAVGLAVAFALGARELLRHLVSRYYAAQIFRPGDRVGLENGRSVEGVILRYGPTTVVIETAEGLIVMPAGDLIDRPVKFEAAPELPDESDESDESDEAT